MIEKQSVLCILIRCWIKMKPQVFILLALALGMFSNWCLQRSQPIKIEAERFWRIIERALSISLKSYLSNWVIGISSCWWPGLRPYSMASVWRMIAFWGIFYLVKYDWNWEYPIFIVLNLAVIFHYWYLGFSYVQLIPWNYDSSFMDD